MHPMHGFDPIQAKREASKILLAFRLGSPGLNMILVDCFTT